MKTEFINYKFYTRNISILKSKSINYTDIFTKEHLNYTFDWKYKSIHFTRLLPFCTRLIWHSKIWINSAILISIFFSYSLLLDDWMKSRISWYCVSTVWSQHTYKIDYVYLFFIKDGPINPRFFSPKVCTFLHCCSNLSCFVILKKKVEIYNILPKKMK